MNITEDNLTVYCEYDESLLFSKREMINVSPFVNRLVSQITRSPFTSKYNYKPVEMHFYTVGTTEKSLKQRRSSISRSHNAIEWAF
jgi:hypothetical protein